MHSEPSDSSDRIEPHTGTSYGTLPPPLPTAFVPAGPWGFWATLGFGLAISLVWVIAQIVVGVGYFVIRLIWNADSVGLEEQLAGLQYDGLMIGISSLAALPFIVVGCMLLARLRKRHGISIRDYFALHAMSWKAWIFWPLATIPFMFAVTVILVWLGAPEIDPWMEEIAKNTTSFAWLAIAVVVCAPLGEEFLFRGFLFKGWMHSRLGKTGTVLLTSFLFAIIHSQYDHWGIIAIFMLGLLLGTARVVTDSLWAPISIHFINNLLATYNIYELMMER